MQNYFIKCISLLLLLFISIFSFGFQIQQIDAFKDIRLGCERNDTHDLGEHSPSGAALSKIDRIGFWGEGPFFHNEKKQAEFLLWMKERFEEVGHCIVLDQIDGIDFTPITKGGHALIGGGEVRVHDFGTQTSAQFHDITRISLEIRTTIKYEHTKKREASKKVWEQYMLVDSSDEKNLMLGYKELVKNLISDLIETNKNYEKYVPVFYITIDTEFKPYLKKVLGQYVSPPLTVIPANKR